MKRTLEFVIDCGQENMDVRTFVRRYLGFSARILTALKYEGEMLKNGEPVHSNAVLKAGDTLTLTLLETGEAYEKADLPFAVLYEDEDFLVLDKPYNMPVHPSPGHDRDSVLNAAAWYFQNTPDFVFRPLYRLDRDTTGALVLAKNKFAANAKLTKTYRAVCEGETPESGCVNVPIGLKPGHKVERCAGIGDEAVTGVRTRFACTWRTLGIPWRGTTFTAGIWTERSTRCSAAVQCIFYARRSTSIKRSRRIFRRNKRRVSRSFFNEKHPAALKLRGSPYQVKFYSTSVWMRRSNSVMSKMRSSSERSRVTLLAQSCKISRMTGTSFSPLSVT